MAGEVQLWLSDGASSTPHRRPVVEAVPDRCGPLVVIERTASLGGKHALEKQARAEIHVQHRVAEVGIAGLS